MPGPVSDIYDAEWGTSANRELIEDAIDDVYKRISDNIGSPTPLFILDLIHAEGSRMITKIELGLTVKEWRIIRFALERAKESL